MTQSELVAGEAVAVPIKAAFFYFLDRAHIDHLTDLAGRALEPIRAGLNGAVEACDAAEDHHIHVLAIVGQRQYKT